VVGADAHRQLAYEAACQSFVLLKNDRVKDEGGKPVKDEGGKQVKDEGDTQATGEGDKRVKDEGDKQVGMLPLSLTSKIALIGPFTNATWMYNRYAVSTTLLVAVLLVPVGLATCLYSLL
jgi:beta-glucosidase-like glycosyl hydrolase